MPKLTFDKELSLKETEEAMSLYKELSEVFIKRNTTLRMSYLVLSAMADAVYIHATTDFDIDE